MRKRHNNNKLKRADNKRQLAEPSLNEVMKDKYKITRTWKWTLVAGILLYFILTLGILYLDKNTIIDFVGRTLIYGLPVLLFPLIFNRLWKNFSKELFISFVFPYSMWSELHIDDLSGVGKAQIDEQLGIFLIIWLIIFALSIGISFLTKLIRNKLNKPNQIPAETSARSLT